MSALYGERSIVEVADESVVLEASEPFHGLSRINLGDAFAEPGRQALFGSVQRTQAVRSFTLRNTVLHAPSMLLFAGGDKLLETRYNIFDKEYDKANVVSEDVVSVEGDSEVIIGFNRPWPDYYHWLVQCLPAIDWGMRQNSGAEVRLALPHIVGVRAELLDLLGHGATARVEIDLDRCYSLPRTIYSEHLNGSTVFGISRTALQTFQRLRKRAGVLPSPHKIIYVARTDSPRRVMRNEEALIRYLESEGVAVVVPGLMSLREQISLFAGAKIVIGAHGGGLSNIIFSLDDAVVYELLQSNFLNPCFNRLAQARGLDYWGDIFPSEGAGDAHGPWDLNIELFKRRFAELRELAPPSGRATAPRSATFSGSGELFSFYLGQGRSRQIHTWHHYFDIYERYMSRFRNTNATVVELGVEQGGGLAMWRAYLGPKCRLFGVDPDPKAKQYEDTATGVFIGDQRNPAFLRAALAEIGTPDVVINAGAHTAAQQINAFEQLYPSLSEHGVYIVKDTHTSLWGEAFMDRPDGQTFLVHAFLRCAELMTWTGNQQNFETLGTERGAGLWYYASEFCRVTQEINFFDSMIVFLRGRRSMPRHERR